MCSVVEPMIRGILPALYDDLGKLFLNFFFFLLLSNWTIMHSRNHTPDLSSHTIGTVYDVETHFLLNILLIHLLKHFHSIVGICFKCHQFFVRNANAIVLQNRHDSLSILKGSGHHW